MIIKSQLTKKEFVNLNFVLLYSKTSMKVMTSVIVLVLLASIMATIFTNYDFSTAIMLLSVMLVFLPMITYINASKSFTASSRVSEPIEYQFDDQNFSVKGESFNAQLSLDKIYKVTELKNWILIWQNKQVANPISKAFIRKDQILELKEILDRQGVKNNL